MRTKNEIRIKIRIKIKIVDRIIRVGKCFVRKSSEGWRVEGTAVRLDGTAENGVFLGCLAA